MLKQLWKFVRALLLLLAVLAIIALGVPRLITTLYARSRVYDVETAPAKRVAVVFGAGLSRSGLPTPVLRDRVEAAAELYFAGKAQTLIMSGADRSGGASEPQAMRAYAVSLGVPGEAIVLDPGGSRTYDTCYRARAVYGLDEVLLVSQDWHLPRALFLCNAVGLEAVGVKAVNRRYWPLTLLVWNIREQFACLGAVVDVYLSHPVPALSEPRPIFSNPL